MEIAAPPPANAVMGIIRRKPVSADAMLGAVLSVSTELV